MPEIKLLRPAPPLRPTATQPASQPSPERGLPDVRTARRSAAAEAGVRRRGTRRRTGRKEGERGKVGGRAWLGGERSPVRVRSRVVGSLLSSPPLSSGPPTRSRVGFGTCARVVSRLVSVPFVCACARAGGGGRLGVRVAAVAVGSARLAGVVGPDVLLGSWTDLRSAAVGPGPRNQ